MGHEKPERDDTPPSESESHPHRPLAQRVIGALKIVKDTFAPGIEEIPFDQIDEISVAKAIRENLYNAVAATAGKDPWNPFDITDVLAGMGHTAMLRSADYQRQFPREYQAARIALKELQVDRVIDMQIKDMPTSHGEWNVYKVINPDLLVQVTQRTNSGKTSTH